MITVLSAVAAACSKQPEPQPKPQPEPEPTDDRLYARFEDFASKASLYGDTENLWSEGDRIKVYSATGAAEVFTLSEGAGGKTAAFSGTLPEGGGPYHALYPVPKHDWASSSTWTKEMSLLYTVFTYSAK